MTTVRPYNKYYLTKYGITEEDWNEMAIRGYLDDYPVLKTLLEFAKKSKLQNPYYKFFEVLKNVEVRDKVLISDIETLDQYYNMNLVNKLLKNHSYCEYYTGCAPSIKKYLADHLNSKYSKFNYDMFHRFLSSMY